MARILVVEDEEVLGLNIKDALGYAGHDVELVTTGEAGLERASAIEPDLVLLDLKLPKMNGLEVLRSLKRDRINSAVVMMTAHGDIETAVTAMKEGAEDFITKTGQLGELEVVVERVLAHQALRDRLNYFRNRQMHAGGLDAIIGRSAGMTRIKSQIRRLVATPAMRSQSPPTILITGETGTGKDMIARAIHNEGPRRSAPLVYVNCTAIPDELFESELFGHVKGAFTDARTTKKGLFEIADGGTLFLDEIGHLSPPLQAKLLYAIEHKTIRPVGGTQQRHVNVAVIAATNRDLDVAIEQGQFRQDLYHRLRVVGIHLPPLREHSEDIEPLVLHFIGDFMKRAGIEIRGISPEAMAILRAHDWPGNVRELSHVIESVVLMLDGDTIRPEHLPLRAPSRSGGIEISGPDDWQIAIDFVKGEPTLDQIENRIIDAALEFSKHNVSRAARVLGLSRDALRYRLQKRERNG